LHPAEGGGQDFSGLAQRKKSSPKSNRGQKRGARRTPRTAKGGGGEKTLVSIARSPLERVVNNGQESMGREENEEIS